MIKRLILALILVFICLTLFSSCNKRKEERDLRFVEYVKVTPEILENKKEFFGYIKAGGDTELSFETAGMITKINFTDGDSVRKGQVIAAIDNKILELEEKESIATLKDAYVQYENAKNYYERIDKLHKVGGISDNDWDKARVEMQSKGHQIEIAKEGVTISKKRTSYGKLYAPENGIILKKLKEENQYTDPGEPVVVFQDDRKTEAKIFVSAKYINSLHNGKKVEILSDEYEEPFVAKIKSITKTSIEEGAYRVTIVFDKKYPNLKDGMAIRALVEFTPAPEDKRRIILLPPSAVMEDKNSSYVWVLEDIRNKDGSEKKQDKDAPVKLVKRKEVKALEVVNNSIVIEGLRRNDLVVTKGTSEIMNGQKVKIKASD